LMYVALGLAAAGGAYFYFKNPDDVQDLKAKATREAEQVKQRGRENMDTVKTRADETLRHGETKYDQVAAMGKEKLEGVRSAVDSERDKYAREAQDKSIGEDVEAKYDSAKGATRDSLAKARYSTGSLYNDARSATERKAAEAREGAERKAKEVKAGWFSWLGQGKSTVESGAHDEADQLKREAAQKVANSAESVEKHT